MKALFFTALFQVSFVSMNVIFISKGLIIPMLVTGFAISFLWTLNVRKAAFGTWKERVVYSTGAMTGTYIGYIVSNLFLTLNK